MIENHQLSRKVVPGISNAINTISEQVQLFVTRSHLCDQDTLAMARSH